VLTILNPNSLVVTNTNDAGPGSLRQAILTSNANPGMNTVSFAITGSGPFVIQPLSPLPAITIPTAIDATTQPGYRSTPIVTLDGSLAGPQTDGLDLTAGASAVRGLVIDRFTGSGIMIVGPGGNVIASDIIGTDAAGDAGLGNAFDGVLIDQSPGNTVGGAGDVISDNGLVGVRIAGAAASGNAFVGDLIGTDPTGTRALGNRYDGVFVDGAPNNTVGGEAPGARNVISGNASVGIQIAGRGATGNVVQGNNIGTDASGTRALGNGLDGIFINAAVNTVVGGPALAQRNLISGNQSVGVRIAGPGAAGNVVQGNYIGTNASGTRALGNGYDGIFVINAANNVIGGTTTGAGNVISANRSVGIQLFGTGTTGNLVQGNFIGTDASGTAPLGNGLDGIFLNGVANNTIGGPTAGARNLISANGSAGIQLFQPSTTGNVVQGNAIGVNVHGVARLGNAYGIFLNGSAGNTLGGRMSAANLIAGNTKANVFQQGTGGTTRGTRRGPHPSLHPAHVRRLVRDQPPR
jgi:titin